MAQAIYVNSVIRALATGASACPPTSLIGAVHAEFAATLARHPPRLIAVDADACDLEDRADHLNKVLGALSAYLTAILDDTAQNVPGGLDVRQIDALLSDLASEVSGTFQHAVERTAWRVA